MSLYRLFNPAYNLLGIIGAAFFVSSFLGGRRTIDLHLHDTYFIIGISFAWLMTGCYFLFLWIVYQLASRRKRNVQILTKAHVWITLAVLTVFLIPSSNGPRKYLDFSTFQEQNRMMGLAIILFLLAQLLFLVNIVIALFRKKANMTSR